MSDWTRSLRKLEREMLEEMDYSPGPGGQFWREMAARLNDRPTSGRPRKFRPKRHARSMRGK